MATKETLEVEFGNDRNANIMFPPLQRRLRGTFDAHKVPGGAKLAQKFPGVIPGQRLRIDADGTVEIFEPLHDHEHTALREKLEDAGYKLAPQYEKAGQIDAATLVHYVGGLVSTGDARIVAGELPKATGKPRTRWHSVAPVDPVERLAEAVEKLLSKLPA
ncbi:hypothetical protein [Aeoliella sp.]|uniref:hypothetical protein n=1 Tax=Aeoliella sp. TaxID=2795800 RepID=UPI003CCBF11B